MNFLVKNLEEKQQQTQTTSSQNKTELSKDKQKGTKPVFTQAELLAEYEKRRIDYQKLQQSEIGEFGDPCSSMQIEKAIKRMSYEYIKKEEELKEKQKFLSLREQNLKQKNQEDFSDAVQIQNCLKQQNPYSLQKFEPRDFQSNISQFPLLKQLFFNSNLLHLTDMELVYWHIINLKMLEDGFWSRFKFQKVNHQLQQDFQEILLMSALKAKKLTNLEEDYRIFEEFVFHNTDEATKQAKVSMFDFKEFININLSLRNKFFLWENNIFDYLCRKYGKTQDISYEDKFNQEKNYTEIANFGGKNSLEADYQLSTGIQNIFSSNFIQKNKQRPQAYMEGDNQFFGFKITNHFYKILFYQEDFKDLSHPRFMNKKQNQFKNKRRRQSRSASASDEGSQLQNSADMESNKASVSSDNSLVSLVSKKSSSRYISKKKAAALEVEATKLRMRKEMARLQRKQQEEEWANSKHIEQLQHISDIYVDYNYIVDQLEDEHQRRSVHTTGQF